MALMYMLGVVARNSRSIKTAIKLWRTTIKHQQVPLAAAQAGVANLALKRCGGDAMRAAQLLLAMPFLNSTYLLATLEHLRDDIPQREYALAEFEAKNVNTHADESEEDCARAIDALARAIESGDSDLIDAMFDACDDEYMQSSHAARHLSVVNELIARGLNVRGHGQSLLLEAVGHDACDANVVKLLLKEGTPTDWDGGDDPIYDAAYYGRIDLVRILVDNNSDPDKALLGAVDQWAHGCVTNREIIVRMMVTIYGARKLGEALVSAVYCKDNLVIVRTLVNLGANVNTRDVDNVPVLAMACLEGNKEAVTILVQNGADIHVENDLPLKYACIGGHAGTVNELIETDPAWNWNLAHMLFITAQHGHSEVASVLIHHGACPGPGLKVAARAGHVGAVRRLIPLAGGGDRRGVACVC